MSIEISAKVTLLAKNGESLDEQEMLGLRPHIVISSEIELYKDITHTAGNKVNITHNGTTLTVLAMELIEAIRRCAL